MQLQYQTARLSRTANPPERTVREGWLDRLRVGQKLGLMALVLGVPLLLLTGNLMRTGMADSNRTLRELRGLQASVPLDGLQSGMYLFVYGHVNNTPQDAKDGVKMVNDSLDKLTGSLKGRAADQLKVLQGDWNNLQQFAGSGDHYTLVLNYQLLLQNNQQVFVEEMLSDAGLTAEKDPLFSSLIIADKQIARLAAQIQLLGLNTTLLRASPDSKVLTQILQRDKYLAEDTLNTYETYLRRAYALQPALKDRVDKYNKAMIIATRNALNETDPANYQTRGIPTTLEKAYSVSLNSMKDAYQYTVLDMAGQMMDRMKRGYLYAALGGIALLLSLIGAGLLLRAIVQRITNPLQQLTAAAGQLMQGQYQVSVPISSRDELGTLAQTFNGAAQQLHENAEKNEQERLEAAALQRNIGEFLDVTMDIAEGDLTKRGKVSGDVLGNVVDSINLMVEELASLLSRVQHTSEAVAGSSQTMLSSTQDIQQGTQLTADETQRVAQQARQITASIGQMAAIAQASAESARRALSASEQGQQSVNATLNGMHNIRQEVLTVARHVKTLSDRSQEIQEISGTISHISSQVNLLSLHASIEAAGAGEAGSRFAVVADEIRGLAELSTEASGRIGNLIKTVQDEIRGVILSVEDSTLEVEQGYQVAGQAGERLREIAELSEVSAHFAQSISQSTKSQVQGIQQMSGAVREIASVAQRSQQSVSSGRDAATQLEALARELQANLSRFRLPS